MVPIAGNGAIAAFYLAPTEATERDFEAFVAAAAQAVAPANGDTVAERAILVQRLGEAATPPLDMIANLLGRAGRVRNPDFPADRISYYEALACARWFGLSLPQKSEWKLAAFGDAGKHRFPWNSDAFENSDEYRNIGDTPVAADKGGLSWRSTNGPAIHHLAGNVAEWLEAAPDSVSPRTASQSDVSELSALRSIAVFAADPPTAGSFVIVIHSCSVAAVSPRKMPPLSASWAPGRSRTSAPSALPFW